MLATDLGHVAPAPQRSDYRIGAIGAGFIMRDVQLVAYRNNGFQVAAIASHTSAHAREAAELRGIPSVYETWQELLDEAAVDVVDIALPPHAQPQVVAAAARYAGRIRGILAQKPLAMNYADARQLVQTCEAAGIRLAVNQNM